jgi:hypothetical protein
MKLLEGLLCVLVVLASAYDVACTGNIHEAEVHPIQLTKRSALYRITSEMTKNNDNSYQHYKFDQDQRRAQRVEQREKEYTKFAVGVYRQHHASETDGMTNDQVRSLLESDKAERKKLRAERQSAQLAETQQSYSRFHDTCSYLGKDLFTVEFNRAFSNEMRVFPNWENIKHLSKSNRWFSSRPRKTIIAVTPLFNGDRMASSSSLFSVGDTISVGTVSHAYSIEVKVRAIVGWTTLAERVVHLPS